MRHGHCRESRCSGISERETRRRRSRWRPFARSGLARSGTRAGPAPARPSATRASRMARRFEWTARRTCGGSRRLLCRCVSRASRQDRCESPPSANPQRHPYRKRLGSKWAGWRDGPAGCRNREAQLPKMGKPDLVCPRRRTTEYLAARVSGVKRKFSGRFLFTGRWAKGIFPVVK